MKLLRTGGLALFLSVLLCLCAGAAPIVNQPPILGITSGSLQESRTGGMLPPWAVNFALFGSNFSAHGMGGRSANAPFCSGPAQLPCTPGFGDSFHDFVASSNWPLHGSFTVGGVDYPFSVTPGSSGFFLYMDFMFNLVFPAHGPSSLTLTAPFNMVADMSIPNVPFIGMVGSGSGTFDFTLNPATSAYILQSATYTFTQIPEPATRRLLATGFAVLALWRILAARAPHSSSS